MEEVIKSLVSVILGYGLEALGIILAGLLIAYRPRLLKLIDTIKSKDELGIVSNLVDMGVELAEIELTGAKGEEKFDRAAEYVSTMLGRYKVEASPEFIAGSVQAGWRRMNTSQTEEEKRDSEKKDPIVYEIE